MKHEGWYNFPPARNPSSNRAFLHALHTSDNRDIVSRDQNSGNNKPLDWFTTLVCLPPTTALISSSTASLSTEELHEEFVEPVEVLRPVVVVVVGLLDCTVSVLSYIICFTRDL